MRPIDADNLLKKVEIYFDGLPIVVHHDMVEFIKNAPTADVAEVKHGEWIKMSDADGVYWACSKCGEDIPRVSHFDPQFDLFPRLKSIEKTNFCPNCGADMRKEGGAE